MLFFFFFFENYFHSGKIQFNSNIMKTYAKYQTVGIRSFCPVYSRTHTPAASVICHSVNMAGITRQVTIHQLPCHVHLLNTLQLINSISYWQDPWATGQLPGRVPKSFNHHIIYMHIQYNYQKLFLNTIHLAYPSTFSLSLSLSSAILGICI